jgi:ABC-type branched-subunit amino acid transport system substrate-binding protein
MPRGSHSNRSRHRALTALVALCLVAAACGGDHGNATPVTTAGGGSSSTTAPPKGETFGTLPSPCGDGDAKGATAGGVTDTSITIGYGDDAGYSAAPGLDKEMSDAVKAMIDWCNEQGGINGREVKGNYYDAKVLEVTQAMTQACNDKVFMMVGQGYVLDSGHETIRIGCKLATIPGFAVSTAFAHGSGMVQPIPSPGDQVPISGAYMLADLFPDAVKKSAFVFAEFPATRETRDKYEASFPEAGWSFEDCDQVYNIAGESDWKPFASNLKACGIEAVVWVGSPNPNLQNFLAASKQVGFAPKAWMTDTNQYDAGFAEWNGQNGGAGDDVYVRMAAVPFELADQVPAVQDYLDVMDGSGGRKALLGVQSTSAFLLWATAVKACGSEVTASCVLEKAAAQNGWTAGGLHSEANPGANDAATCGLLLKLNGSEWEKVAPKGDEVFDCNPKYLVKGITTTALTGAKLNADRVATQYGTFTPS